MAGEVGGGDSVPIGKHAIDRLLRQSVSDPAEWTKGQGVGNHVLQASLFVTDILESM
tara:strand:+ start:221 stop:391 length:171 start_codon:yes stop_codon:yes gene_type:complete